jgi:hypothetical protein
MKIKELRTKTKYQARRTCHALLVTVYAALPFTVHGGFKRSALTLVNFAC